MKFWMPVSGDGYLKREETGSFIFDDAVEATPVTPDPGCGMYVPVYSTAMATMVSDIKATYPKLPVWANFNPASGPGDDYTDSTAPRTDIQDRIDSLLGYDNLVMSGYTGTWYGRAMNDPPEGSQWGGVHLDVVYTLDKAQYDSLIAGGGKSVFLLENIRKYSGVESDIIEDNVVTGSTTWYNGLNAIMLDEAISDGETVERVKKLRFYKQLIDLSRAHGLTKVRANPGTTPPIEFFKDGWFDSVSIYEGSGLPLVSTLNLRTSGGTYARKASFVAHQVSSLTQQQVNDRAPEVGYMFITDDGADGNPYDEPPTYYNDLANWLNQYNISIGVY